MKKIFSIILLLFLLIPKLLNSYYYLGPIAPVEKRIVDFGIPKCKHLDQSEIPTILIPGTLASWYSEEGYDEEKVKRWIADPITHVYDTLIYTFKENGYTIGDVFYKDEFNIYIKGNPKKSLYVFGYDWKKDNKITATLLDDLKKQIKNKYIRDNGCEPKVNIIAHSMGGLVARAMLEDMCVEEKYMSEKSYYENIVPGKIKNYKFVPCKDNTKINKLITIATPHRGSPKAFPIWEKGDIESVETFSLSIVLKGQLDSVFDSGLYKVIHGYEKEIPNGIISLGQLLPDIENNNEYNNKLKYLFKKDIKKVYDITNKNYPQNSFLEELNKKENIDKMWDKIDDIYLSYYSRQTGNYEKNNIVGFNLKGDEYRHIDGNSYIKINFSPNDITEKLDGKDIYDRYSSSVNFKEYNLSSVIRNQLGLGGDGTVPTYNLLLVPNNSKEPKEIENDKFESIEIKCYKKGFVYPFNTKGKAQRALVKSQTSDLYENMGLESELQVCSHANMPIATSIDIYDKVSGSYMLNSFDEEIDIIKYYRKKLLEYIGQANYYNRYVKSFFGYTRAGGIKNNKNLDELFKKSTKNLDGGYKPNFDLKSEKLKKEFARIDSDISSKGALEVDLNFAGSLGKFDRVLAYDVRSPINLLITDTQGRRIGVDPETGMIINEIPGAWTSGDTEGSHEPEFFLIPVSQTGAVEHKIKTYGTGDGEYHIVVNNVDLGDRTEQEKQNKKLVIAGNAKKAFGEDYNVVIAENGEKTVKNLTKNLAPSIEIESTNIKTNKQTYKLRYTVRGNSENVSKIKYTLSYLGENNNYEHILESKLDINGIINLKLSKNGKYKISLELLNKEGDSLGNKEAKKIIFVQKLKTGKGLKNRLSSYKKEATSSFPEKSENFANILDKDLYSFFNLYNNKKNYFDSSLGFGINHSLDLNYSFDNKTKQIKVLLPNGKTNIFDLQTDFNYKKLLDNNLELKETTKYFEIIDGENIYHISKKDKKLSSVFLAGRHYNLYYDNSGKLESIEDDKKEFSLKFLYNKHTQNLEKILDSYKNSIEFSYQKLGDSYILEKLNSQDILYNHDGDIKTITGFLQILFKQNPDYKKRLETIKIKLDKLANSAIKKQRLIKAISRYKQNYLKKLKNDYTREVSSYFIEEIMRFLRF